MYICRYLLLCMYLLLYTYIFILLCIHVYMLLYYHVYVYHVVLCFTLFSFVICFLLDLYNTKPFVTQVVQRFHKLNVLRVYI